MFNPSLAKAPPGLCPRCVYIAAVRVDPLHQCHDESPLLKPDPGMPKNIAANAFFKGTAIAVLDRELRVLGWTWLLNAPQHQVSGAASPSRWFVPSGVADRFPPPWAKAVYDVRVIAINQRLFVSYVCKKCAFSVAHLQVTAEPNANGGIRKLRAWQSRRYSSTAPWAQGRNQALFVSPRNPGEPNELMVQPWMSIIASFGAPTFAARKTQCRKGSTRLCGATPAWRSLRLEAVANERRNNGGTGGFGWLERVSNVSHRDLAKAAVGGFRLSTTSNLARVTPSRDCTLHLGVGHVHRSEGELNKKMFGDTRAPGHPRRGRARRRQEERQQELEDSDNRTSFMWGFQYTHFFYALEPYAPFRVMATSKEFCLSSEQNASDCESIQFVSGVQLADSGTNFSQQLLLSYGVNDCEAKVTKVPLVRALRMLQPLSDLPKGSSAAGMALKCFPSR